MNYYKWEALISLGEKERKNKSEGKKKREKKDRAFARPCVELSPFMHAHSIVLRWHLGCFHPQVDKWRLYYFPSVRKSAQRALLLGWTWVFQCWPQPQVFRAYSFNSCNILSNIQPFRLTGLLWWQKLTFPSFTFKIWGFRSSILLSL